MASRVALVSRRRVMRSSREPIHSPIEICVCISGSTIGSFRCAVIPIYARVDPEFAHETNIS